MNEPTPTDREIQILDAVFEWAGGYLADDDLLELLHTLTTRIIADG